MSCMDGLGVLGGVNDPEVTDDAFEFSTSNWARAVMSA